MHPIYLHYHAEPLKYIQEQECWPISWSFQLAKTQIRLINLNSTVTITWKSYWSCFLLDT